MNERGIFYVAYGERARSEAALSLQSVTENGNHYPVIMDTANHGLPAKQLSRYAKTNMLRRCEFSQVLYLDADTRVRGDLSAGFAILDDGWDIAMAYSANQGDDLFWHIGEIETYATLMELHYAPLQLQAGVMFVQRNERTMQFFDTWHKEWLIYGDEDQAAFLRALAKSPVKIWLLGRPWNGGVQIEHRFGMVRQ